MNQKRANVVWHHIMSWILKKDEDLAQGFDIELCQRCGSIEWRLDRPLGEYVCPICGRRRYHNEIVCKQYSNIEHLSGIKRRCII